MQVLRLVLTDQSELLQSYTRYSEICLGVTSAPSLTFSFDRVKFYNCYLPWSLGLVSLLFTWYKFVVEVNTYFWVLPYYIFHASLNLVSFYTYNKIKIN